MKFIALSGGKQCYFMYAFACKKKKAKGIKCDDVFVPNRIFSCRLLPNLCFIEFDI